MSLKIAYPSKFLKPYIKQYWSIDNIWQTDEIFTQRIIPNGLPELTFYLSPKPNIVSSNKSFDSNFLLKGQHNDFYDIEIKERLFVFSVMFYPHGLSQLFNLPMTEITNKNVSLFDINKSLNEDFENVLSENKSFEECKILIEQQLIKLLYVNKYNIDFQRLIYIIEIIQKMKGLVSIETLAQEVCLSRKQFERIFLIYIGISPKQYLKIIRFQSCIALQNTHKVFNLTELAYQSGYYDQSHFIHDIKIFTGLTPKQFFYNNASVSDFFE